MKTLVRLLLCVGAIAILAGCGSTPTETKSVHYFFTPKYESEEDAQKRKDCMADNSSFNQRQLVVSAASVQNAWVYCFRKADIWYPGKESDEPELDHSW